MGEGGRLGGEEGVHGGIHLTPAGELLVEHADAILDRLALATVRDDIALRSLRGGSRIARPSWRRRAAATVPLR